MEAKCCSAMNIVAIGLGVALVVFFAGVTAAIAAGQTPPTALWAAGGAVSGALIGLLVPSPGSRDGHAAAANAAGVVAEEATHEAAKHKAAAAAAEGKEAVALTAQAEVAEVAASNATHQALAHRAALAEPETPVGLLAIFFVLVLGLGIALAAGVIVPPPAFVDPLKNVTTAVIALASASGSALIGIFAPSPSK
jgi:hypothetical protein